MANGDDSDDGDVSELIDEWQDFKSEGDEQPDQQPDPEGDDDGDTPDPEDIDADAMGLQGEMAEVFQEATDAMMPDNPELLDLTVETAMAESVEEDDEDSDAEVEVDTESDPCYGSQPHNLSVLGERGKLDIFLNHQVADIIIEGTVLHEEPTEDELADLHPQLVNEIDEINTDLNSDEYVASREGMLEIHWDEPDTERVHDALETAMHPTEDELQRDPDAEINLLTVARKSCMPEYDNAREFHLSREGSAADFTDRGPWTGRKFDVQDMIDELAEVTYESEDGAAVVVRAVPFK